MNANWSKVLNNKNESKSDTVRFAQQTIKAFYVTRYLTGLSLILLGVGFLLNVLGLGTGLLTLGILLSGTGVIVFFALWNIAEGDVHNALKVISYRESVGAFALKEN